ncbi:uncharacterized protein LOC144635396 [Oculina patagonica]
MGGRRFVYVLVLLGLTIVFVNGEKSAPPGCRVLQVGKNLQCRGAGLSKIPKIPQGILIADFTDNQITHIAQKDLEHLEKLQKVYLKGNPFHCACNLEWLRIKLHSSPTFIQDGGKIECATPLKFQSKALKSLSNLCDTINVLPLNRFLKRNAQASPLTECRQGEWLCEDKTECILNSKTCNGHDDCRDGSDEFNCSTLSGSHCNGNKVSCPESGKCIPRSYICDWKADCADGSDESGCAPIQKCLEHEWLCKDRKSCILQTLFCNGKRDCIDGSDEFNCTNIPPLKCQDYLWPCKDRSECISSWQTCNGSPDCDDGSDESSCRKQINNIN